MKLKIIYPFIGIHILVSCIAFSADDCDSWFAKSKIRISEKDCELKCSILPVDMGTFDCPSRCKSLCQPKKTDSCKITAEWLKKIKNLRPPDWPYLNEQTSEMSPAEQAELSNILKRMPDSFMPKNLEGFYKLERPRTLFNLGTPSIYHDRQIIFYQKAFDEPEQLPHFLIHEAAHYLHENDLKADFQKYKLALGWKDSNSPREGEFINENAKQSPEEDFALNFENYILNPLVLKARVPKAFTWIKTNLKDKFKLKECGK